jgi:hypothetical protein
MRLALFLCALGAATALASPRGVASYGHLATPYSARTPGRSDLLLTHNQGLSCCKLAESNFGRIILRSDKTCAKCSDDGTPTGCVWTTVECPHRNRGQPEVWKLDDRWREFNDNWDRREFKQWSERWYEKYLRERRERERQRQQ